MKAKVLYILSMLLMISLCSNLKVFSRSNGEYEYTENSDGGMTIVNYLGTGSVVNIPSQIDGKKVTRIGDNAFRSNPIVTDITIPNTVSHIGIAAFWNNNGLKSITLPDSVTRISEVAFAYCFGLESVTFGASIEFIGKDAFVKTPFWEERFREFDSIDVYCRGVFIAEKQHKFGLIDMDRNIVLPFEYETICPGVNGLFEVKKDSQWFYLDPNFKPIVFSNNAENYKDIRLHLEIFEIVPEEGTRSTETWHHPNYGEAGMKTDLLDHRGNLNIVYEAIDSENIYIARFDENYKLTDTIKITKELPLFGTAVCDGKGNYYILYGACVEEDEKASKNIVIVKYSNTGRKLGQASYTAGEMSGQGTKQPFSFGSASMAIHQNILAAHFARVMFQSPDGMNHQSSTVVYADIDTMNPVSLPIPYASHSFDQHIISASDEGFVLVDKGDAYPRGFALSRVTPEGNNSFETFHFAESTVYQTTRSELGGLIENSYGYVLAASSIKKLTYVPIPESETISRNIFVQVIKKNFMDHSNNADKLLSKGEYRAPDGMAGRTGLNTSGQSYFLPENVADYGVAWLTGYTGNESACNPKIVKLEQNASCVLWEKFNGQDHAGTYYAIIDALGNIIREPVLIPNARLSFDKMPLYINGEIVWSVIGQYPQRISVYRLIPGLSEYTTLQTDDAQTYVLSHKPIGSKHILSPWATEGVKKSMEINLPQGKILSDFQNDITREEFCEMAVRLYDLLSDSKAELPSSNVFNDTNNPYVLKANALGIIKGVGEGRFAPEARVTRQEIAVMYERLLSALKINPMVTSEYRAFADEEEIAPWAKSTMQLLNKLNIIAGVGGNKVAPQGSVTREQAIIMSIRLFELK